MTKIEPPVICRLCDAIASEVEAEVNQALADTEGHRFGEPWIGTRYVPRTDRKLLDNLHVSVYITETNPMSYESGRGGDEDDHTIEIAFTQAIPEMPTDQSGIPNIQAIDNTEFGNQMLGLVEVIKGLWRPEDDENDAGRLRNKSLVGCKHIAMTHDPPYEPVPLIRLGVLAIVISVTYRHGF